MIELVLKALTIMATALSIALAVSQLTATGRLRRREQFWQEAAERETPGRRAIIEDFRRKATAQLVAREAVPLRELTFPGGSLIVVLLLDFLVGYHLATKHIELVNVIVIGAGTYPFVRFYAPAFPGFVRDRRLAAESYLTDEPVIERDYSHSEDRLVEYHHWVVAVTTWKQRWGTGLTITFGLQGVAGIFGAQLANLRSHIWVHGYPLGVQAAWGFSVLCLIVGGNQLATLDKSPSLFDLWRRDLWRRGRS
jgi:hypothetical protein